jgi:hypothetical protein
MSDTATKPRKTKATASNGENSAPAPVRIPVPVTYGLRVLSAEPIRTRSGGGGQRSEVHAFLAQVANGEVPPNQWYAVADFPADDERAATAASGRKTSWEKQYPTLTFKVGVDPDDKGMRVVGVQRVA